MNLAKFKELRLVVKNCSNLRHNGETYEVAFAELNSKGEVILFLKIPNEDTLLTIDLKQIDYVKVYHSWIFQYKDTSNNTILNVVSYLDDETNLEKIGVFDVYRKERNILNLVK